MSRCDLDHASLRRELLDKGFEEGTCPDCDEVILHTIADHEQYLAGKRADIHWRIRDAEAAYAPIAKLVENAPPRRPGHVREAFLDLLRRGWR